MRESKYKDKTKKNFLKCNKENISSKRNNNKLTNTFKTLTLKEFTKNKTLINVKTIERMTRNVMPNEIRRTVIDIDSSSSDESMDRISKRK
jgi:hypothetical protein